MFEEDVIEDYGVVETMTEHMDAMDQERTTTGFVTYDPMATISLEKYFDGLITQPTGIYHGQTFQAIARSTPTLAEFVGWIIRTHDEDTKLLYMVQQFDVPQRPTFEDEPHRYVVRFAIIPRV